MEKSNFKFKPTNAKLHPDAYRRLVFLNYGFTAARHIFNHSHRMNNFQESSEMKSFDTTRTEEKS